jgi:hypothetical protein
LIRISGGTDHVMIIKEVAPTLSCTASGDGFLFELPLNADPNLPPITKVRLGPYFFKPEYQPKPLALGLSAGGPESGFWLHKKTPWGWSRWHWEVDTSQAEPAFYLVTSGVLSPGKRGIFQFVSIYPPGGLRAGLEVYRDDQHVDYGVTGPNYEHFLAGGH